MSAGYVVAVRLRVASIRLYMDLRMSYISLFLGDQDAPLPSTSQQERKFLAFESCLLELCQIRPQCFSSCTNKIKGQGTMITVKSRCRYGHLRTWQSQPMINGRPAGNRLLLGAIFFSGLSAAPTLRMLKHKYARVEPYNVL